MLKLNKEERKKFILDVKKDISLFNEYYLNNPEYYNDKIIKSFTINYIKKIKYNEIINFLDINQIINIIVKETSYCHIKSLISYYFNISEKNYYKFCLELVKKDGLFLKFVPFDFRNKEIVLTAVKQNGKTYLENYFDINLKKDKNICLATVKSNSIMTLHIKTNDKRIILLGIKLRLKFIKYIKDKIIKKTEYFEKRIDGVNYINDNFFKKLNKINKVKYLILSKNINKY